MPTASATVVMRENPNHQVDIATAHPGTGTAARRCRSIGVPTCHRVLSGFTRSSTTVLKKSIGSPSSARHDERLQSFSVTCQWLGVHSQQS